MRANGLDHYLTAESPAIAEAGMRLPRTTMTIACVSVLLAGCSGNDLEGNERATALSRIRAAFGQLSQAPQLTFTTELTETEGKSVPQPIGCVKGQWQSDENSPDAIEAIFEFSQSGCDSGKNMEWQLSGTRIYTTSSSPEAAWQQATIPPDLTTTMLSLGTSAAGHIHLIDHVTDVRKLGKQKFDTLERQPDGINYQRNVESEITPGAGSNKGTAYAFQIPFSAWLKSYPASGSYGRELVETAQKEIRITATVRLDDKNRLRDFDSFLHFDDTLLEIDSSYGAYDTPVKSYYPLLAPRQGRTSSKVTIIQTTEQLANFLNNSPKRARP